MRHARGSDRVERRAPRRQRGFTLIEMLVVVAIIGLISAVVIPSMIAAVNRSKQVSTEATMRSYGIELERFYVDNGSYPVADSMVALRTELACRLPLKDGWGHLFDYASFVPKKAAKPIAASSARGAYSLQSFGRDGIDGKEISRATRNVYALDMLFENGRFTASIED